MAGQLLTSLGRLFTATLKIIGFSLGVEDVIVRHKVIKSNMYSFISNIYMCVCLMLSVTFRSILLLLICFCDMLIYINKNYVAHYI